MSLDSLEMLISTTQVIGNQSNMILPTPLLPLKLRLPLLLNLALSILTPISRYTTQLWAMKTTLNNTSLTYTSLQFPQLGPLTGPPKMTTRHFLTTFQLNLSTLIMQMQQTPPLLQMWGCMYLLTCFILSLSTVGLEVLMWLNGELLLELLLGFMHESDDLYIFS